MLGTETGSVAEPFFNHLGYTPVGRKCACTKSTANSLQFGIIPGFGYSPEDGRLTDGIRFYKHIGFTKAIIEARKN